MHKCHGYVYYRVFIIICMAVECHLDISRLLRIRSAFPWHVAIKAFFFRAHYQVPHKSLRHSNMIHHDYIGIAIALLSFLSFSLPCQPTSVGLLSLKHNDLRRGMSASHGTTLPLSTLIHSTTRLGSHEVLFVLLT